MADLQRHAPQLEVRLNGVLVKYLQPLEVGRSVGGRNLDYGLLEVATLPLQPAAARLQNIRLLKDLDQKELEITLVTKAGRRELVHWGFVDAKTFAIDRHEAQQITSRLQPYHFGVPLFGQLVWSPVVKFARDSGLPLVFNPEYEGRIIANRSNRLDELGEPLFLPPECQRTPKAMVTNGATQALSWTLPTAVRYLCSAGNAGLYIRNPTLAELQEVLPSDERLLRNHKLPFGRYLPELLDDLLEPYGFGWYVDLADPAGKVIRVFRRGAGTPLELQMGACGSGFDFASDVEPVVNGTSVEAISITADVSSRFCNQVVVVGDQHQIEDTFHLVPAWDPKYDDYFTSNPEKLVLHGGKGKHWETEPDLARAWRDWVLNEDGSYTRLRPSITGFFDFNRRIGFPLQAMAARRRFHPCLTLGPDLRPIGEHHGTVVEFFLWDPDPTTSALLTTGKWMPITDAGEPSACHVQLLQKECGIRFSGKLLPKLLLHYYKSGGIDKVRIRITATVELDARLTQTTALGPSPNVHRVVRVVDAASRFKHRLLHPASLHFVPWITGKLKSTAVDDMAAAVPFSRELLENWNQASINGAVTLPGTDWDLKQPLGKPFKGISGRKLDFATTTAEQPEQKYPTVMAYKLDFRDGAQATTLSLDTWRRDV